MSWINYLLFLFFSFTGRISRGAWWLALLAYLVVVFGTHTALQPEWLDLSSDKIPPPNRSVLIFDLLAYIPSLAITIKRLNDRDYGIWPIIIVVIVSLPFYIGPFFGLLIDPEKWSPVEMGLGIALAVVAIWMLIDNGFLPGTKGPIRHGPDPRGNRA